jgi:D-serine deaminase-like pyridoxal phosphate-dependent protein
MPPELATPTPVVDLESDENVAPARTSPVIFPELTTPIPVVDLDRLDRNLTRMANYAAAHRLGLRPHIKTHKAPAVGKQQVARGAIGLTVATLKEAEVMSEVTGNLLLAYPPVGSAKLKRLMSLPASTTINVAVDSAAVIGGLAAAAREAKRPVRVLVEIDMGLNRVGVTTPAEAVALAKLIRESPPLEYAGVAFYPGHIRVHVETGDAALTELNQKIGTYVEALKRAGLAPAVVSGGSTPTVWHTHELAHITEFRPGTYVYNDRTTAAMGACAWEDCAVTVLATVVSTAVPGQAIVDAGVKALGREPLQPNEGEGFGQILEHPEVVVSRMWEEHGALDLSKSTWRPKVGERVRIVPNHVCVVTHLFDNAAGVRGDRVETKWPIAARGRD